MFPAWIAQLTRGILALLLGLAIALTLDHSAAFGLAVFGGFAVLSGVGVLFGVRFGEYAERRRGIFLAHGAVTLGAGAAALVLVATGTLAFGLVLGIWALVTGVLETSAGILSRGVAPLGRDWRIVGVLTLALGLVALILPADYAQTFAGERGVTGVLTASVVVTGALGAWAILVGVVQTISAVSVRGVARSVA